MLGPLLLGVMARLGPDTALQIELFPSRRQNLASRAPVRSRRRTAFADTWLECLSKAVQRRSSSSVESHRSRFSSWNRGIRRHGLSARHPQSMARFIIITQQCQYTVGAVRHILELAVNFLDISALHTRHFELAQLGQNDIPEHAGIVIRNGDTLMYFRMAFQVVMAKSATVGAA